MRWPPVQSPVGRDANTNYATWSDRHGPVRLFIRAVRLLICVDYYSDGGAVCCCLNNVFLTPFVWVLPMYRHARSSWHRVGLCMCKKHYAKCTMLAVVHTFERKHFAARAFVYCTMELLRFYVIQNVSRSEHGELTFHTTQECIGFDNNCTA